MTNGKSRDLSDKLLLPKLTANVYSIGLLFTEGAYFQSMQLVGFQLCRDIMIKSNLWMNH